MKIIWNEQRKNIFKDDKAMEKFCGNLADAILFDICEVALNEGMDTITENMEKFNECFARTTKDNERHLRVLSEASQYVLQKRIDAIVARCKDNGWGIK